MTVQDATVLPGARSVVNRLRSRRTKIEHWIQHVDPESYFSDLFCVVSAAQSAADELLVPVEGVLDSSLLVITGSLLPFASTEFAHRLNRRVSRACSSGTAS